MDENIWKKLHVKEGMQYLIRNAPKEFIIPRQCTPMETRLDYIHLFCKSIKELKGALSELSLYRYEDACIWVSYPKKESKLQQDLNRTTLWDVVLLYHLHPVSQISLDETWSAIRLKKNEEGIVYTRLK